MVLLPLFLTASAVFSPTTPQIVFVSNEIAAQLPISSASIEALIDFYASAYDTSSSTMREIVKKESNFNQYAELKTAKEDSVGLVQINLYAHHDVTRSMALSPFFALNFLAYHLSLGECTMWTTCPGSNSE